MISSYTVFWYERLVGLSFGDLFGGPTQLDREIETSSDSADASRKLFNRLKFGSESILVTPFVYGAGKAIKAAATRGKNIEFSNSKLDRYFNEISTIVYQLPNR